MFRHWLALRDIREPDSLEQSPKQHFNATNIPRVLEVLRKTKEKTRTRKDYKNLQRTEEVVHLQRHLWDSTSSNSRARRGNGTTKKEFASGQGLKPVSTFATPPVPSAGRSSPVFETRAEPRSHYLSRGVAGIPRRALKGHP